MERFIHYGVVLNCFKPKNFDLWYFRVLDLVKTTDKTALRYIDQILRLCFAVFREHSKSYVSTRQHPGPHSQINVRALPWHALNPNFNPIEHLWGVIEMSFLDSTKPTNTAELIISCQRVWNQIPKSINWSTSCKGDADQWSPPMEVTQGTDLNVLCCANDWSRDPTNHVNIL